MSTHDDKTIELVENIGRLAARLIDTMKENATPLGLDYTHMAFACGLALKGLAHVAQEVEGITREEAMRGITHEIARAILLPDEVVQSLPGEGPSTIIPVMPNGKH